MTRHEIATARTPDYRRAPRVPYRTSPARFPAADPAAFADPLLIPTACTPRSALRPRTRIHPLLIPGVFQLRLLRATRADMPVVAFTVRTDPQTLRAWDVLERNLEHLARLPGVRFVTPLAAVAGIESRAADRPSPQAAAAT